ncbi:ParB/RepB/Spo0J family partition protein [Entomospira culicis]|uniref:ParB N-terminal domain-containing protein n=1 Tax=Entomospira culicis TaxID=2719989 RepID=A0A968GJP8_9SPIO|nr:ParB/RepB/Spo0J family partition protein [Entomospira culicis]NIZ19951.1 ParB N-terminal domain-containing protein [Entomospira culicis]NIZ70184.1 ParB N-terminal domain-containing protein [Entomospira culicis]WDI38017.1 ParB/RepB/Spo0J family partition protein [Entomospira culicis]WDI39640.1 ParB/RepB/Spo0J family partition protein [Entomospira culicis]
MNKVKDGEDRLMAHLTAPRPGLSHIRVGIEDDKASGLMLSGVQLKEIDFFKNNELNTIFESLKSSEYFTQLKRDIAQDGIINALIALPDGQLIEGHSRLKIAQELGFSTVPVRFILNTLSAHEIKRRVYLGNLNRFEIPSDLRLILFAEIYPDYFYASAKELDQSHRQSDVLALERDKPTTAKAVAAAMGLSDRQVRNEKEIFLLAKEIAGHQHPTLSEISKARELLRQKKGAKRLLKRKKALHLVNEEGDKILTLHVNSWPSELDIEQILEMNYQFMRDKFLHVEKKRD